MMEITVIECFTVVRALELLAQQGQTAVPSTLGESRLTPKGKQEALRLFDLFLRLSEVPEDEVNTTKYRIEKIEEH